jgi:hypothetical protein
MESPDSQSENSIETAKKWNAELAKRVARWKRVRLASAIVFTVLGAGILYLNWTPIWSVPCFVIALIAYLLYVDSRDQLREIKGRKWATITPRISRLGQRKHETTQTPSSP